MCIINNFWEHLRYLLPNHYLLSCKYNLFSSISRGFKFIYKKFLNLLPAIGDDDDEEGENSETNQVSVIL